MRHTLIDGFKQIFDGKMVALDAAEAKLKASAAFKISTNSEKAAALAPYEEQRHELRSGLVQQVEAYKQRAGQAWETGSHKATQFQAAWANPSRAADIERLAMRMAPADLLQAVRAAVADGDGPAAVGLRLAVAARGIEAGQDATLTEAVRLSWLAGTAGAEAKRRELVRTNGAYATCVAAAYLTEPARVLAADEAAHLVPMPDGSVRRCSDAEIKALLGDD